MVSTPEVEYVDQTQTLFDMDHMPTDPALDLIANNKDDSQGDESMCDSQEEQDTMPSTQEITQAPFRQIDYLWLFNPYTKINERPGFVLDDSCLMLEDYNQMRYLNRRLLSTFLQECQEEGIQQAALNLSETTELEPLETDENWADEFLDEELKSCLMQRQNGEYLSVDITAHIEYFYNTLECDNKTENPFRCATKYPALVC